MIIMDFLFLIQVVNPIRIKHIQILHGNGRRALQYELNVAIAITLSLYSHFQNFHNKF